MNTHEISLSSLINFLFYRTLAKVLLLSIEAEQASTLPFLSITSDPRMSSFDPDEHEYSFTERVLPATIQKAKANGNRRSE